MGYYTYYSLDVKGIKSKHEYNNLTTKLDSINILNYALVEDYYHSEYAIQSYLPYEPVTWYNHDNDMIELSEIFPDLIFKLHGEGDSSDDIWNTYYQNGKSEECRVIMNFPTPKEIEWGD